METIGFLEPEKCIGLVNSLTKTTHAKVGQFLLSQLQIINNKVLATFYMKHSTLNKI